MVVRLYSRQRFMQYPPQRLILVRPVGIQPTFLGFQASTLSNSVTDAYYGGCRRIRTYLVLLALPLVYSELVFPITRQPL